MEIFKELPHEFIPAKDLAKVVEDKSKPKLFSSFKCLIPAI